MTHVTLTTRSPPHLGGFLTETRHYIEEENWEKAVENLCGILGRGDPHLCYAYLSQIIPQCNAHQMEALLTHLPDLLNQSPELFQEQKTVAIQLGQWHQTHLEASSSKDLLKVMPYFAKALQIAAIHDSSSMVPLHHLASQLFIPLLKKIPESFEKRLSDARGETIKKPGLFKALVEQISTLKRFCLTDEDRNLIRELYGQAARVLLKVAPEKKDDYGRSLIDQGLAEWGSFPLPFETTTQRYWKGLATFRASFSVPTSSNSSVRELQTQTTQAFKNLFQIFLEDAFTLLGPPPCGYDFRAMGSCGREEVCPYSDLEFMILIQDAQHAPYFKSVVEILELQIASLGETPTDNPPFTCIYTKNPSGFHIDMSPAQNPDLIRTPLEMAKLQGRKNIDHPQNIEQTVLKTLSLSSNDPSLFATYQQELAERLSSFREQRALKFFKRRLQDFQKRWEQPFQAHNGLFNIKEQYVELLNHLLSDIALFCGISHTNTLDIIDALVQQEIFTPSSGRLLQQSAAASYTIRLRLHHHYQQQKEEARCPVTPRPLSSPFLTLEPGEISALERCYWLVLVPLYAALPGIIAEGQLFKKADLVKMAFMEQVYGSTVSPALIRHLAKHLLQIEAPVDLHLSYYQTLSKQKEQESSRESYLQILEAHQAGKIFETLVQIPTPAGLRASFQRGCEALDQATYSHDRAVSYRVGSHRYHLLRVG